MKGFKNKLLFFRYFCLLWIGYFVFSRTIFLLFYYDKTLELGIETTLKTFLYGLRLDLSFASYLSVIPFFLILISFFIEPVKIHKTIKWYLENEDWMDNITSGDYQKYYSEQYGL